MASELVHCGIVCVLITALKVLLVPLYHSTDYEVHRNWLALTAKVPLSQWYVDETSQWTLDYPPFFAYFEWLISSVIAYVEPDMLTLQSDPYVSSTSKAVHRASVIVSDCTLLGGAWLASRMYTSNKAVLTFTLLVCNPALLLVDHVHFQYNGFLLGVLLLSMTALLRGRVLIAGALFTALLHLKHLYLVLAPVYFVYILSAWVVRGDGRSWARLCAMAAVVLIVSALSLGPFVATGQFPALLSRLFPFERGLLHAYWAPNAWALYAFADKVLAAATHADGARGRLTGGLVQETPFAVLPQVTARTAAVCVLIAMAPCLVHVARQPRPRDVPRALAYAALCGVMFGYHVHEKAALTVLVPLAAQAVQSRALAREYSIGSALVTYAVHPLLFEPREAPVKWVLGLLSHIGTWLLLHRVTADIPENAIDGKAQAHEGGRHGTTTKANPLAAPKCGSAFVTAYMSGLIGVEVYSVVLHSRVLGSKLPFLTLMLRSVYCATGVTVWWLQMLYWYIRELASSRW